MKLSSYKIGYVELTLAQLCLSVNVIFGKILATDYPIPCLLMLRFLIGFSILAVYLAFSPKQVYTEIIKLRQSEWLIIFLKALCGGFLFNILTLHGLQYTTATTTSILQSSIPAFVVIFSLLILKERLTERKILSVVLTVFGILMMSIKDLSGLADNRLYGLLLVLLAVIPGALFTIFSKMINSAVKPLTAVMLMNFINMLFFLPLALQENWILFTTASLLAWLQIFVYSVTGSLLFVIFWYRGVARIAVSTAALFIGVMPIGTSVLAYFFLHESLSAFEIVGMALILAAIYVGTHMPFRQSYVT